MDAPKELPAIDELLAPKAVDALEVVCAIKEPPLHGASDDGNAEPELIKVADADEPVMIAVPATDELCAIKNPDAVNEELRLIHDELRATKELPAINELHAIKEVPAIDELRAIKDLPTHDDQAASMSALLDDSHRDAVADGESLIDEVIASQTRCAPSRTCTLPHPPAHTKQKRAANILLARVSTPAYHVLYSEESV